MSELGPNFKVLFESIPGSYLVLDRNLVLVAISDELMKATLTKRKEIIGRHVFDVLPDDPSNPTGFKIWRDSLETVLRTRKPDFMPDVKYSVKRSDSEGGGFEEKHWRPSNFPVLGTNGEVQYIIHRTEETTALVEASRQREIEGKRAFEAELRMKYALESAGMGDWELNLVTGKAFRSLKHDQCFGYDELKDSWKLEDALRHIHPDDRKRVEKAHLEAMENPDGMNFEARVIWPDGTLHWISVRGRREVDDSGKPVRLAGLVWDITESKKAEQDIINILESMSDSFFSLDKNWMITRVNSNHEKVSRLKREDQLGKNFLDLFFQMPEARESKYWINYHKAMNLRVPVSFEDYYPPLDLWTLVRAYPTPDGGLAIFFTDSTVQKKISLLIEAEKQKFEAIFVDSPASMALLRGPTFIFEKINSSYRNLMGGRDLEGKTLHEALPELIGQPFHDLMKNVFVTGQPFIGREILAKLIRRPGGDPEDTYFDFTYTRVQDGEGKPYGIYIHAFEITDKVLTRKQLEKTTSDLERSIQSRDEFLSVASHELKTPITSLRLHTQLAKRLRDRKDLSVYSEQSVNRLIDLSDKQANRLTRLVDDMLDMTRIRTGKLSINKSRSNLSKLVEEVLERLEPNLKEVNISVRFENKDRIEGFFDQFRIEQVITNLLTNAMRYGEQKPVVITLSKTEGPIHKALIAVRDQGIGLEAIALERVFNRYEREVNANEISGLGLGLFITRQIVEEHGGKIWVESAGKGHGSEFFIELPLSEQKEQK